MPTDTAQYAPDSRTRIEKFADSLFPAQWCDLPDAPASYADCLHVETNIVFDWKDRIRILVTGKVAVRSKVVTEKPVGASVASSVAYPVRRFKCPN